MGDRMKQFILANLEKLCNSTDPNETLLDGLLLKKIIPQETHNKILRKDGDFSKNLKLYSFLQISRTDGDIDGVMFALEQSSNGKVLEMFKSFHCHQSDMGKPLSLPPPVASRESSMRTHQVASLICTDPKILAQITDLHTKFNVGFDQVFAMLRMVTMDVGQVRDLITKILQSWRGSNFDADAKGKHVLGILVGAGYKEAADTLRKAGLGDDTQIVQ